MADETLNELRQALDDAVLTHTGRSIGDLASQHVLDDIMPYITALRSAQADEPRAIVRAFALAMERKLAANDATKGGWRDYDWMLHYRALMTELGELLEAIRALEDAGRWGNEESAEREDVLAEAADVANYLMFACDVIGALPPTDERGRAVKEP